MSTLLFQQPRVRKFFNILRKLDRYTQRRYGGECEQIVFVRRTIHKWLSGKSLVIYREENGIEYKQYCSILNIRFAMSYNLDEIVVSLFDPTKPVKMDTLYLRHNETSALEGEWDGYEIELIKKFTISVPLKEYVFSLLDLTLRPKRAKSEEARLKKMEVFKSVFAKTEREAFKLIRKFVSEKENLIFISGEILEVKENYMPMAHDICEEAL